ncbi:hypothetical protein [Catellatospora vulcania]|uniref:hypothetical protein n=1 Tax=Catellatospora vulcania TaxID=1460450 RepID=UPI0012D3856D|nr:hypothetical protein [Catellatospora vulcania]
MPDPTGSESTRAPRAARASAKKITAGTAADTAPEPPADADPRHKGVTLVAGGALSTVLTSSAAQAFDMIPQNLQPEVNGASAVVAAAALAYIIRRLIPRKGSVGINWDFSK